MLPMYSSHSVLMHQNVDRISVARHSVSSSTADAIGGATIRRGKVGTAVMGGNSRGCAVGCRQHPAGAFHRSRVEETRGGTCSARCVGVLGRTAKWVQAILDVVAFKSIPRKGRPGSIAVRNPARAPRARRIAALPAPPRGDRERRPHAEPGYDSGDKRESLPW